MNDKDYVFIIGAGGHAKVVLSTLLAAGKKVAGLVDDNPSTHGSIILGHKVWGSVSLLANKTGQAAVLAIGDNKLRKKLALSLPNLSWITVVHPQAYVHASVHLSEGTVIFAGAIIQPEASIGKHVIINTGSTIDHDCTIQDFVHIAPGAHLAGNVEIKDGSFLGIGTKVIPSISIGEWSTIAAGSVVIDTISDHVYAKGLPAKAYKKASETI